MMVKTKTQKIAKMVRIPRENQDSPTNNVLQEVSLNRDQTKKCKRNTQTSSISAKRLFNRQKKRPRPALRKKKKSQSTTRQLISLTTSPTPL